MIKANFQALRYANPAIVRDCNTYEEFISKFTDIEYFAHAKQLRQVIFGKLNGKRTASIEKYISNLFAKELAKRYEGKMKLYSIKTDEIILKFLGTEDEFNKLKVNDEEFNGFRFRVNKFKLVSKDFKRGVSDRIVTAYIKEDYLNGKKHTLHCVPDTYYPQVYKLLNGMEITPSDLVFYYEHELAKFMYPLELIK